MQSGFRRTTRAMANKVGNIVYSAAEKEICARLAGNDVDESWADEHIKRSIEEIHSTWTASETERRTPGEPEVTIPQFITHHYDRSGPVRTSV
jgi:hypothetical protein